MRLATYLGYLRSSGCISQYMALLKTDEAFVNPKGMTLGT
jgi:hypothetical protein